MKRRIFLVDDHPLVREWFGNLINEQEDLEICGSAQDATEALAKIGRSKADLAVVDLALKNASGLNLIKNLQALHSNILLVVLTMHEESLYAERVLRAGARGYVMKNETSKKIITALRQVLDGKIYVSEKFATTIAERFFLKGDKAMQNPVELLSDRELEIFQQLGEGKTTAAIAKMFNLSLKTVQSYYGRIKVKLQLSNATELLREAVRWNERKLGI